MNKQAEKDIVCVQSQRNDCMNYPNPIFKTKKVLTFIADLIIDYDNNYYYELSDCEKAELTALLMEASGRSGEAECIVESNDFDQTVGYFKKALCGTREDDEKFLEIIKKNAIHYYEKTMQGLFEYVLNDYRRERNEWLDYAAKHGNPDEAYDFYRENLS